MKATIYIICLAFAAVSCNDSSKKSGEANNTDTSINKTTTEAPVQPTWMDKIGNAAWIDNSAADHKLVIGKPTTEGGIIKGEFKEHFPGLVNICRYEGVSEGVLNVHLLKTIHDGVETQRAGIINLKLQLTDGDNTLVVNYPDGRTLRYTRSKNSNATQEVKAGTDNSPEANQARLWMDKITAGDWKNVMNAQKVVFNKPVQEGNIIKGEIELHEESFVQVFRYERVSAAEMKCKLTRFKVKGDKAFTEENKGGKEYDVIFKTELLDNGNTLVLTHANGKADRYTH